MRVLRSVRRSQWAPSRRDGTERAESGRRWRRNGGRGCAAVGERVDWVVAGRGRSGQPGCVIARMPERLLPVPAQAPQVGRHHVRRQVGHLAGLAQHQRAGVVGNQIQAPELLLLAPTNPPVAGTALERPRLPAQQRQPLPRVLGDVAKTPTARELDEPQIVMLEQALDAPMAMMESVRGRGSGRSGGRENGVEGVFTSHHEVQVRLAPNYSAVSVRLVGGPG